MNGRHRGLVVQKHGLSVRDMRGMLNVCRRIKRTVEGGARVVAVISATGQDTDGLVELARRMKGDLSEPPARERDLLMATGETVVAPLVAIGLQGMGVPALVLTGGQAGIETNARHGDAEILGVRPGRVVRALDEGRVPVVAGFQGASPDEDVTTLGRYGGDATAVWLAAELRAEVCEIYTGLPGILTADRQVVPEARVLPRVTYEEAMELGAAGLPACQPRALEIAEQLGVPVRFRSLSARDPGTLVVGSTGHAGEDPPVGVCAVAHRDRVAKVRITGVEGRLDASAALFEPLHANRIHVDGIAGVEGGALTIVTSEPAVDRLLDLIEPLARLAGGAVTHDSDLARISVVGRGMQRQPGVAARMFRTLTNVGVNIDSIMTSEIRITCIVRRRGHEQAVRALHSAFDLGRSRR